LGGWGGGCGGWGVGRRPPPPHPPPPNPQSPIPNKKTFYLSKKILNKIINKKY